MSIIDKVIAAVTPAENAQARQEARAKAQAAARPGDWLSMVIDHHVQIEAAFAALNQCADAGSRSGLQRAMAIVLTGHANAEESVLYPALARIHQKSHATTAYSEQAEAKMHVAELLDLQGNTQEYREKLAHIREAVLHHMYEEEGTWFLELRRALSDLDQARLTQGYKEEFDRYIGGDAAWIETRRQARSGT
jgi:hemerythrin superfamily protein